MFAIFLAGLAFGLSLLVAIGAQNAFVLRQGALRRYVGSVVTVCTVSDIVLIGAGVVGTGAMLVGHRTLFTIVRCAGAAALLAYAIFAARRASRPARLEACADAPTRSRAGAIGASLAFTWLNPAVYLDTVVLLGSVAGGTHSRWAFGAGAALASAIWFVSLGYGARLLTPLLRSPRTWRVLDGLVAVIMMITAVRVLMGV